VNEFIPKAKVKLDWRAYFRAFCDAHGDPVKSGGRMLFADGWTYSASSHAGPEWPPPADPRIAGKLRQRYWRLRREMVRGEMLEVGGRLEWLRGMAAAKSAPLKQRVYYRTENDAGELAVVSEVKNLDLSGLEERLKWLRKSLAEADEKLKEFDDVQQAGVREAGAENTDQGADRQHQGAAGQAAGDGDDPGGRRRDKADEKRPTGADRKVSKRG
jgi:hypothetical protein